MNVSHLHLARNEFHSIRRGSGWNLFCTANIHGSNKIQQANAASSLLFHHEYIPHWVRTSENCLLVVLTRRFHQYTDAASERAQCLWRHIKNTHHMCMGPFDSVTACWAAFLRCHRCWRVINLNFFGLTTHKRALSAKPIHLNEFDRVLHQQLGQNKTFMCTQRNIRHLIPSIQICDKIHYYLSRILKTCCEVEHGVKYYTVI